MRQYSDEERRELEAQQREAERLERERGERERREVEWQATVPDEISTGAGATVTVTIPGPPAPPTVVVPPAPPAPPTVVVPPAPPAPPAPPTVVVPPAPPAPQTFELVVGVALGPGFEVRLLPAMLPLAALVGAGYVAVELIGPPQVLARAEAELRAVFGAQGLRLDAVTHVSAWDPTVRARITVYPPGARRGHRRRAPLDVEPPLPRGQPCPCGPGSSMRPIQSTREVSSPTSPIVPILGIGTGARAAPGGSRSMYPLTCFVFAADAHRHRR
jgi:hypothetical protein